MNRSETAADRSNSNAFTLVELLVVVSIIALLIAILLPSLRKAREQAKLAKCLAHMTGIAKASLTYAADDPGENMIPVPNTDDLPGASGAIEWGGKAGSGQSTGSGPAYSIFGTGAYRGPAHRPLNATLFKGGFRNYNPTNGDPDPGPGNANWLADAKLDLPIYRCPSDTGYAGGGFLYTAAADADTDRNEPAFRDEGLTAYNHYGTSYVANTFCDIACCGGCMVPEEGRLRSQSVYLTPLSQLRAPAASIAYQEMPSRYAWLWGSWAGSGCEFAMYEDRVYHNKATIPGWHRQPFNFNVAFADGHASTVKMKGCFRPTPNLGRSNYPACCSSCNDPYVANRCATIRGPGWQLDTLPAASVLTPYFAH